MKRNTATPADRLTRIGKLFIAILLIAVLEGALRKWVSSSLTLPLIALRDLLALYAIFYGIQKQLVPIRGALFQSLLTWTCLLIVWGLIQAIINQTSPIVLLIGLRFWLLYFWFAYVASMAMQRVDFQKSVTVVVVLLVLMTPLVLLQQRSPPGSFINTQLDTEAADIFVVVAGIVRPTGTFSFTLGYTDFLALAAPVVLALGAIAAPGRKRRILFALGFVSLLIGTLLSGSRGAIINYAIVLAAYLAGSFWFGRGKAKLIALGALVLSGGALVGAAAVFSGAIEATQQRFAAAAQAEDLFTRVLTIFLGEPTTYAQLTWLGKGLGVGSNLAGYFQTGERAFVLAETEAARILLEGGVMGLLFILVKIIIILTGLWRAWSVSRRYGVPGPMLAWITVGISLLTWSSIGQLSTNVLIAYVLTFGVLILRYPARAEATATPNGNLRPGAFGNSKANARPMPGRGAHA